MPRNAKPKDAAPPAEAPARPAQALPAEKPAGGGRRSQETSSAPAKPAARQTRRAPLTPQPPVETATAPAPTAAELGPDLRQLRLELTEALPLLQAVPRQAHELSICLKEMGQTLVEVVRQLREAEQQAREARAQADRMRHECAAAEDLLASIRQQSSAEEARLASLRGETEAAEVRLAALRRESADAEGILHGMRRELQDAHQWLEGRRQVAAPAPKPAKPAKRAATPPARPRAEGHNRLGATVDPGVVVAQVLPDSPASRVGLVVGDVITAVNGTEVFSGDELHELVYEASPGEALNLRVERAGAFAEIPIRLEALPADRQALPEGHNRLGVTVERGVVIAEVAPGTPAAHSGLLPGDVILSANGTDIVSGPQLRDLIHDTKPGAEISLDIERGEARFEVRVHLEALPE